MFDYAIEILTSFARVLPILIPFILVMNLICSILWGDK